jgi:monofunctional biosynthetic peptidoglycan transglycosylase
MARSDPPFDAADETTTHSVGRERPPAADEQPPTEEPSGARKDLPHAHWYDPHFDTEQRVPQISAPISPQPLEPTTAEPKTVERVGAEIAAALMAPKGINQEQFAREDIAPAHSLRCGRPQTLSPAAQALPSARRPQSRIGGFVDRAGKVLGIVVGAWFSVVFVLIVLYRFVNPPFSTLMAAQWLSGTSVHQEWVPLDSISPNLIHAVIVSEDGRFCDHWGIDFVEIAEALKRTPHGIPRGASTITMQVAKNLFLWPAKSYLRKVIEVPLTYAIELFWPKRRILEVYLNIAEWGPGIFGAEAASRAHFNHSASRLSSREAAQLAVVLPNPIVRDAGSPGPRTAHRASVIQRRTGYEPEAVACILGPE